jgi:hypothetical protein
MPRGRPTLYRPEYAEQATKLCQLGATNERIAEFFGVSLTAVQTWLRRHPEFAQALKEGREFADANVALNLYRRAVGYEHEAVKIVADANSGAEHVVPYTQRYPPDTTACIFWLKNRRPDLWRDKREHEMSGDVRLETVTRRIVDPAATDGGDDGKTGS